MSSRWEDYDPARIPTKTETPELERFLESAGPGGRLLDLGCGGGDVARALAAAGYEVCGVDINDAAIERARAGGRGTFRSRDVTASGGLRLPEAPFRIVVCQLVVSVVGGTAERQALLRNAADVLSSGGWLYLSASEVSDDVNPGYAALYRRDFPKTKERYTYFSRDDSGEILYETHHFTAPELSALVEGAGLTVMRQVSTTETSSRRPDEAANFLYLTARKI